LQPERLNVADKVPEHDHLRANVYRLLARLLAAPADAQLMAALQALTGDDTDLGTAFGELSATAGAINVADARQEYQDLFIGVGRGELVPYGSYYLTGFLNEKPLARLRNDMAPLGIARSADTKEPEDHAGALMDMMAGLIDGSFGSPQPLAVQKDFFAKHVGSWTPHFFADLEKAKSARLFRPVGRIGVLFMEIEEAAFAM
jgi:TorA maturation chaperone TorD